MNNNNPPRQVSLEVFDWQPDEQDKDANFKGEVAAYSQVDPMPTIDTMSRNLGIPVGAIIRYVMVKWATSGSEGLMEIGPIVIRQMSDVVEAAEAANTDEERLAAYRKLSQIISWLSVPLNDSSWEQGRS